MKTTLFSSLALLSLPTATMFAQAIQNVAAEQPVPEQKIEVSEQLPVPTLVGVKEGNVSLLSGLFKARRELGKAYINRLQTNNLLQNHYLEAGSGGGMPLEQMHQGWESPTCQLRGHFAGHWLSAAAKFAANDHDAALGLRVHDAVLELEKCQNLNGDGWVGSIPEKYFTILEEKSRWIWSPQYTVHKTMMGLFDTYLYTGDKDALKVDERSADWFLAWTDKLVKDGNSDVAYMGESAGMLELWADLYGATHDARYLTLASRYAMPDMFRQLLDGEDPLTNNHTNASIPWVQGAARLYEVTGDVRYRTIVEDFWKDAVVERGMFATTGNNAGEFWIPKQQFGRFLASRTQEHCTVYNMIRVAQFLFEWTGKSEYADYIERAVYNGILAQQNPNTGMVAYFLPTKAGGKKVWGSETRDFWCCHGTMVQAQAMYEDLVYYTANDGVTVAQFIPSKAALDGGAISITQTVNWNDAPKVMVETGDVTHQIVKLGVTSQKNQPWTLRIRQPWWALETGKVTIDGKPITAKVSDKGFIEITRDWTSAQVTVSFAKRIVREALPGDASRFALLDGPVVLAAVGDKEPELLKDEPFVPIYEHLYESGRDWQSSHYSVRTKHGTVELKPLYEVVDEAYSIYCSEAK